MSSQRCHVEGGDPVLALASHCRRHQPSMPTGRVFSTETSTPIRHPPIQTLVNSKPSSGNFAMRVRVSSAQSCKRWLPHVAPYRWQLNETQKNPEAEFTGTMAALLPGALSGLGQMPSQSRHVPGCRRLVPGAMVVDLSVRTPSVCMFR